MLRNLLLLAAAASPALGQTNAKSWTGWDWYANSNDGISYQPGGEGLTGKTSSCKPVCAGAANNQTLLNNRYEHRPSRGIARS